MASTALLLLMAMAAILGGNARCFASDTISADSAISGSRTIVSKGGSFELGFFSPAGSSDHSYYVGILLYESRRRGRRTHASASSKICFAVRSPAHGC
ncbi:unnamed protein product [Urochloa humidicola]